ncbi:hypothetical protein V7S43_005179 [Phytophthora oleae]|uniref:Crinkler effector protein N-terminal domain-containing protein n=1 Tax=Phytophthora oleae TaxID=2107226 RepID=A0ABD3FVS5_9STRA
MLKLFCAIIGQANSAFGVEIDDAKTVSKLKVAVVDQSGGVITAPHPNLQLFLAKKDGA